MVATGDEACIVRAGDNHSYLAADTDLALKLRHNDSADGGNRGRQMYHASLSVEAARVRHLALRDLRPATPVLLGLATLLVTGHAALALPPAETPTTSVAPNSPAGSSLGPGTYAHIINGLISMPGQGGGQSFNVGQSGSPSSASLGGRDGLEACNAEQCGAPENWNVWLNSRVLGAYDSLAQTNGSGFIGMAGGDYKVMPRLALGLSLGVEAF